MEFGIGNPNPVKLGKRIKELERLYGIRDGSAGDNGSNQYIKKELEPNSSAEAKNLKQISQHRWKCL